MRNKQIPKFAIAAAALTTLIGLTLLAQRDR